VTWPFFARRSTVVFAGFLCLQFVRPSTARAQAEELPPELGGTSTPVPSDVPAPAGASSQPLPAAPTQVPAHRPGILFMPYVGFSLPAGDTWAGFNPSPRLGGLLGWHITERLSLNVEVALDYARLDSGPRTTNDAECSEGSNFWCDFLHPPRRYVDITFSPLVSFRAGQIRLGPKIGWFTGKSSDSGTTVTFQGLLAGLNAGLFHPYRGVTLAGLLSVNFRHVTSADYYSSGADRTAGLTFALLL
jgi:hypothetical protein